MIIKPRKNWRAAILVLVIALGANADSLAKTPQYAAYTPNPPVINTQTTYGYPSYPQARPADPFAVQSPPAFGTQAPVYPTTAYQVAQLPPQVPQQYPQPFPPQIAQPQPGFVPQNYAAPGQQPFWNTANPFQYGGYNPNGQPRWTAQANWIYMTRTKSSSFPLLVDMGGATLVNAEDLGYGWKSGFDVGLSRRNASGSNFELRYFQIDGWSADLSAPFAVTDGIATNPPSFLFDAGTVSYLADSSVHSFEANFVDRQLGGERIRFSIGFRWMEVSENLTQTFSSAAPTDLVFAIDTNNHLYGLQFGGDGVLYNSGRFNIVGWSKGGIYANVGDQSSLAMRDIALASNGARATTISYVGETGLLGEWELFPSVSIIGGYQLLWISGVALAADQLPNMDSIAGGLVPTGLDQSGVFYHGAFVGIDIHF